jgi:hypothetical protein
MRWAVSISFDPNKAANNLRKHGVRFADAEAVLADPLALTREDDDATGEQRFVTIGADSTGRLLVVVFTWRGEEIQLISARPATAKERESYES